MSDRPRRRNYNRSIALWSCAYLMFLLLNGCGLIDWLGGKRPKQSFCEMHPDNQECQQEYPDADTRCRSNMDCAAPTGVCDLSGSRMCVQCIAPDEKSACIGSTPACATDHVCVQCVAPDQISACTGKTPICAADHTCQPCRKHQDCASSHVCLADGSCAQADQVAYVDPVVGNGSMCSVTVPCKRIADALATSRPILKLNGLLDEQVQIADRNVSLFAEPGSKLTSSMNGVVLEIRGSSQVAISDLTVTGASGPATTGLGISLPPGSNASLDLRRVAVTDNTGGGISASGALLTIAQSTISGNQGGGISVVGSQFDITNSIITGNGGPQASFGGIRFDQVNSGNRRFEFNTVTNNGAMDGSVVGVVCTLVAQPVTFANNIVYANQIGGTRSQVGGANCNWNYSDIGPDTVIGTGNMNADPLFINPTQSNFHLQPTSPARGRADPGSTVRIDIDGETRPQGNGYEMGADEIP
jgi:hypothetical protein